MQTPDGGGGSTTAPLRDEIVKDDESWFDRLKSALENSIKPGGPLSMADQFPMQPQRPGLTYVPKHAPDAGMNGTPGTVWGNPGAGTSPGQHAVTPNGQPDGTVIYNDGNGREYKIDPKTGRVIWARWST